MRPGWLPWGIVLLCCGAVAGCARGPVVAAPGRILAVGAERQYADVIAQIGGRFVTVAAVMDNPNVDPHSFEASPSIAGTISSASLVVQNGLGYDGFMNRIEAAAPAAGRRVISVGRLLRLPDSTPNPHLWFAPRTMPAVAAAVAGVMEARFPRQAAYFRMRLERFDASLRAWGVALAQLRFAARGAAVITTEPVADGLLAAAGLRNLTPFSFQADVMNGLDPAPQGVSEIEAEIDSRLSRAFVYNAQVTDSLTERLRARARAREIPSVAVYEIMPAGYSYQRWMVAETDALRRALVDHVSTEHL